MEAVEVIGEHAGFHEPLAVVLAPNRLAPAGVGDGEVDAVGAHIVPMLSGHEMGDRITGVVQDHLGVAGSTGAEVHEHGICGQGVASFEVGRCVEHAGIEVQPALALDRCRADALLAGERLAQKRAFGDDQVARLVHGGQAAACSVDQKQLLDAFALAYDVVADLRDVADGSGDDGLDGGAVQAVFQVVFLQHEGCGNHDGTQLGECGGNEPELVMASQDDHDEVSLAHAVFRQVVGGLIGPFLHVRKGEYVLFAFGVAPDHRTAVRVIHGDVVDHVVSEIEVGGYVGGEGREHAFVVVFLGYETEIDVPHVGYILLLV